MYENGIHYSLMYLTVYKAFKRRDDLRSQYIKSEEKKSSNSNVKTFLNSNTCISNFYKAFPG